MIKWEVQSGAKVQTVDGSKFTVARCYREDDGTLMVEAREAAPVNRYYLTHRPPSLGTHPRGTARVEAFDDKTFVEEIGRAAWGYVEYDKPLADPSEWDMVEGCGAAGKLHTFYGSELKVCKAK